MRLERQTQNVPGHRQVDDADHERAVAALGQPLPVFFQQGNVFRRPFGGGVRAWIFGRETLVASVMQRPVVHFGRGARLVDVSHCQPSSFWQAA